jgi:hypothetical protein
MKTFKIVPSFTMPIDTTVSSGEAFVGDGHFIMEEIWKDINGFKGLYQISSFGRVKSLKRVSQRRNNRLLTVKEKVLKNIINNSGYYYVTPRKNNTKYTFSVHRLVAENFLPPINGKEIVNHKDGNKLNCNFTNLEWCTSSENNLHAYKTGLRKPSKKIFHHNLIKVINNETGEIYNSLMSASISSGLKYHTFFYRLKNKNYKYQKLNN